MNFQFINFQKNHKTLLVFLVSFVLSFVIFGNGIFGDFVFDDVSVVQNRGDLKDISNLPNLFVSPYHHLEKIGLYRPLTMVSYAVNHYINSLILPASVTSSGQAAGFHILNIIIHALNSFLVFWLIGHFFKNWFISFSAFLLFLTHPIHTEAVTSIVGRAELLAFFWSLVAIYFFVKKDRFLSAISFLLAMFSKEVALAVLPIIFYIDWALIQGKFFSAVRRISFFILPLGVYSLLRFKALGSYFLGDITTTIVENPLRFLPFGERLFTAFKVFYLYFEKLVWPIHLSADYSYNAIVSVKNFLNLTSLLGIVFFILLLWFLFKKSRQTELALGSLLFLAPYLMISNLIKPVGTIMGERLMYFPSLGFLLFVSYYLFKLSGRIGRKPVYAILVLIAVFYGARTIDRNKDWRDARTLFSETVKESPNSLIARMALAAVHVSDNEWDEAKNQLNIARNIYEDNSRVQNLVGIIADHEGDLKLAEESYKKSLELNPDAINAQINLAELYAKEGKLKEAGVSFKKVIDFYPVTEYVVRYAYIQIALGDPDGALDTIGKYLGGDLNHPDLSALTGTAYFVRGEYKQAAFFLRKALELGNRAPEVKQMLEIAEDKI